MIAAASSTAVSLLALMKLKGVGRVKALKIVDRPMNETGVESCRDALLESIAGARLRDIRSVEISDAWMKSEEQLNRGRECGVRAISFHDEGYPARLRVTPDPPAVLFVKGNVQGLHATGALAVVGTREPTPYGKEVAQRSGRTATESGYVIVSGLAHGCDTHAHEGCLEARGIGVAVLAHGLDKVYPAANRGLAERLLELGGCLTSEYPVGTTPIRSAFAERDRIQSGLSDGVLVIETDVRGGTMHTVRFARDQGRALACIDHPERYRWEDKTRGNRLLIEEGCTRPIPDGDALMIFLNDLKRVKAAEPDMDVDAGVDEPQKSAAAEPDVGADAGVDEPQKLTAPEPDVGADAGVDESQKLTAAEPGVDADAGVDEPQKSAAADVGADAGVDEPQKLTAAEPDVGADAGVDESQKLTAAEPGVDADAGVGEPQKSAAAADVGADAGVDERQESTAAEPDVEVDEDVDDPQKSFAF